MPVLAGLIVAALALVGAIIGLTTVFIGGGQFGGGGSARRAGAYAYGLPRLLKTINQPDSTLALIGQFRDRFIAATGSASGQPSGQYREPVRSIWPPTSPVWVMYVGYNSDASLGAPQTTILKLIASLTKNPLPSSSWSIDAGPRGGSARCAVTKITDVSVSIGAWATPNTFGALMSPTADTKSDELAVLTPQMRLDLQPG